MASTLISNPIATSDRSRDNSRRRRKKKSAPQKNNEQIQNHTTWKSHSHQQIYTSKLHQALSRLNLNAADSSVSGGQKVRQAADRVLAVTAKGRTRWSRSILMSGLKRKRSPATAAAARSRRWRKARVTVYRLKGKTVPAVHGKVKMLGRLVPGCREQSFPVILEETIDYISAVQMQIRAMTHLVDRFSASTSTSTAAPPS